MRAIGVSILTVKTSKTFLAIAVSLVAAAAVAVTALILPARGDLDENDRGDLILRNDDGSLTLLSMNGHAILAQTNLLEGQSIGPYNLGATTDINGDGIEELVFDYEGMHFAVYGGTNAATVPLFGASLAPWHAVAGGDFNGDGYGDLVFQHGDSGVLSMALMTDTNVLYADYLWEGDDIAPWHPVGGGDFDLDGKSDLVLQAGDDSYYCVVGMDGLTVVYAEYVTVGDLTDLAPWRVSAISDLDGDHTSDLLLTGPFGEKFSLFMNGASGYAGDYVGGTTNDQPAGAVIGPR